MDSFKGTARFRTVRLLGSGGMGSVYEAVDEERGGRVALKTLKRLSGGSLYRFKNEFRSLADLRHPNLIRLHELIGDGELWFFTMELVEGADFLTWVRAGDQAPRGPVTATMEADTLLDSGSSWSGDSPLPDGAEPPATARPTTPLPTRPPMRAACDRDRLVDALGQLCRGLMALHAAGKIHRDVKPSNVLVSGEGRVVLVDFGLAKDLGSSSDNYTGGALQGTPPYMAPELALGVADSPAVDFYAMGTLLYQALTGRLPFRGSLYQMLVAKQNERPSPPEQWHPDVDPTLSALAMDLLQAAPDRRPAGEEVLRRIGRLTPSSLALPAVMGPPGADWPGGAAGRERALEALRRAWAGTRAGRPHVVQLRGPAGAGKTALVERFLAEAQAPPPGMEAPGAVVLRGRCIARESVPYRAFDGVVDGLSSVLVRLSGAELEACLPLDVATLAALFPVLHRVPALQEPRYQVPEPGDARELRRRAFDAFRGLLSSLARRGPVALFIDDLQWVDRDSLELLLALTRTAEAPPVLLVTALQPGAEVAEALWRLLPVDDAYATTTVLELEPVDA